LPPRGRAGNANWSVIDDDNSAVGIAIKNNFGLIVAIWR